MNIEAMTTPTNATTRESPTLCIGLDIAWFGGSKKDHDSQHDCVISAIAEAGELKLQCNRLNLINRDPDAALVREALLDCVNAAERNGIKKVVLAIDAPLKTTQTSVPAGRKRAYRACERYFSECRKKIDNNAGGSKGWHPKVQPGVPLAPRVVILLNELEKRNFKIWSKQTEAAEKLIIECFPAEAIWCAKRLGYYDDSLTAAAIKSYKKQKGKRLSEMQVRQLVDTVIRDSFAFVTDEWSHLVDQVITWLIEDSTWIRDGYYCGGKLLDDVVDSMISLSTALAYTRGKAHIWQDPNDNKDGHIIGPGAPLTSGEKRGRESSPT